MTTSTFKALEEIHKDLYNSISSLVPVESPPKFEVGQGVIDAPTSCPSIVTAISPDVEGLVEIENKVTHERVWRTTYLLKGLFSDLKAPK